MGSCTAGYGNVMPMAFVPDKRLVGVQIVTVTTCRFWLALLEPTISW